MYFKIYVIVLTTCLFCLILLMQLQTLNFKSINYNSTVGLGIESKADFYTYVMGDPRRGSGSSSGSSGGGAGKQDDHFDIVKLNHHLKKCLRSVDNQVDLDEYISIFKQLYKFFLMLGTVFGFVGSDVKSKIEILEGYRNGATKDNYETVEKMLEYEKSTDYILTNKESSASRTLLRLHRALNFVSKFLFKVDEIKDTDGTAHVSKEAYGETLAKYHPWLIRKGADLAMYALPTKKELIKRVCDGRIPETEVRHLLHEVIASTEKIYNKCEAAYREKDLLDLP